jgi:hypothetical protein
MKFGSRYFNGFCFWTRRPDLVSGKSVPACQFYFIGVLKYAVSDPGYAWLQEGNYLSHGAIDDGKLKISQYRVVNSLNLAELKARVDANRPRS